MLRPGKKINSTQIEVHLPEFDDVVPVDLEFNDDCYDREINFTEYRAFLKGEEIELKGTNADKAVEAIHEYLYEEKMYLEQERAEAIREQRLIDRDN